MEVKLTTREEGEQVLLIGSVRVAAFLEEGKTVLILNSINAKDFITMMGTSSNQVIIKAGDKIIL